MNLTRNCLKLSAVMLACVSALVGCGGGGSSSTQATPPAPPAASTMIAVVPAASYAGGAADAYNRLNAERQACGFGLLAQNTSLDAAASAHSYYVVTNNIGGHEETPGATGFTGVNPADRAKVAGYFGTSVRENVWIGNNGEEAMRGLLSGVYHMFDALGGSRDVGLSFRVWPVVTSYGVVTDSHVLVLDYGYIKGLGKQLPAAGEVLTYPCNGSSGVNRLLRGETPNPVPGRNIGAQPIGTPIAVVSRDNSKLNILSASVTQVGGAPVALLPIKAQTNDPFIEKWTASIIPDAPLAANTKYEVRINGTINETPFEKHFTFTTGTN